MNVNVHVIGVFITILAALFLNLFGLIIGLIAWTLMAMQVNKKP